MSSEDIFKALDEAVHDWKSKLEVAVGEGLKRLRRSTKDNKLKMQYLPGNDKNDKPKFHQLRYTRLDLQHVLLPFTLR